MFSVSPGWRRLCFQSSPAEDGCVFQSPQLRTTVFSVSPGWGRLCFQSPPAKDDCVSSGWGRLYFQAPRLRTAVFSVSPGREDGCIFHWMWPRSACLCGRQVGGGGHLLVVSGRPVQHLGLPVPAGGLCDCRAGPAAAVRTEAAAAAARPVPRPTPLRAGAHAAGCRRQLTSAVHGQRTRPAGRLCTDWCAAPPTCRRCSRRRWWWPVSNQRNNYHFLYSQSQCTGIVTWVRGQSVHALRHRSLWAVDA